MDYGSQSMVAPLARVLVHRPGERFGDADPEHWHYASRPDLERAQHEHDAFVALVASSGAEIVELGTDADSADSIYTHDSSIVTDAGAIVLNMGKPLRRPETAAVARRFAELGVPIHRTLTGDALAEGGDLLWLDHDTLAAGHGFRTNAAGIAALQEALEPLGARLLPVALPYHRGPAACLHLMSLISMVDADLAVVYRPLLPVPFLEELERRAIDTVDVPDAELDSMGPNVLALGPRDCLMLEGNPVTGERLERAGCRVQTYRGNEVSLKGEGGATCLTRPILRSRGQT